MATSPSDIYGNLFGNWKLPNHISPIFNSKKTTVLSKWKPDPNDGVAWTGLNFYYYFILTLIKTTVFQYFKNKQDQSISAPA